MNLRERLLIKLFIIVSVSLTVRKDNFEHADMLITPEFFLSTKFIYYLTYFFFLL